MGLRDALDNDLGCARVRSGLALPLEAEDGIEKVAEAGDIDSALRAVLGQKPDVLVLDLNMPGTQTSLEALPGVSERSAQTSTVVLTMQKDPGVRATRAAGRGAGLRAQGSRRR